MANYIRCRACGYVLDENHLKELCPACGLPKTVFEPYTKKIAPRRKFLLDQHFHPIAVHFPQVFLLLAAFMPLLSQYAADPVRSEFLAIAKWSVLVLPFTVLAGFLTGLFDGQLRFKKIKTPLLINKMIAGTIFQLLSIAAFILYLMNGFADSSFWIIVSLNLLCIPLSIYLGRAGSSMFDSFIAG